MRKRELYRLEIVGEGDAIEVLRTDIGVQGYVKLNGDVLKRYPPYAIPKYIVKECATMFEKAKLN